MLVIILSAPHTKVFKSGFHGMLPSSTHQRAKGQWREVIVMLRDAEAKPPTSGSSEMLPQRRVWEGDWSLPNICLVPEHVEGQMKCTEIPSWIPLHVPDLFVISQLTASLRTAGHPEFVQQHGRGPNTTLSKSQFCSYSPCFDESQFFQEQSMARFEKHSKMDADDITDVVPHHNLSAKWQRCDIQMWHVSDDTWKWEKSL